MNPLWQHLVPSYQAFTTKSPVHSGADGSWIYSQYGKVLDLCSGYWSIGLGHKHPEVVRAVRQGFFADLFGELHLPAAELAERLYQRTGYARVIFNTSGTDAVDSAIRVALQCSMSRHGPDKTGFLAVKLGFHGTSGLTLGTSGFPERRQWIPLDYPLSVLGLWVTDPEVTTREANSQLNQEGVDWKGLSAFLFEPILGVGGARTLNPRVYREIASRCREAGALIVADEVTTGCGRTGAFLASERLVPKPDMVCLGKMLANGEFPLSVTLLSRRVWEMIEASSDEELNKYLYGSCYAAHPAGCLAALEVLKLTDDDLLAQVRKKGEWFGNKLKEIKVKHSSIVRAVRGLGLMWAVELPSRDTALEAWYKLLERRVRVAEEGKPLMLMPPLTVSYEELEFALKALDETLASLSSR